MMHIPNDCFYKLAANNYNTRLIPVNKTDNITYCILQLLYSIIYSCRYVTVHTCHIIIILSTQPIRKCSYNEPFCIETPRSLISKQLGSIEVIQPISLL